MINEWPQHYEDQLLDDVVNVFVEPWYWENLTEKDVAKVAVEAIAREWESEAFFNAVDAMARQKGHER